VRGSFTIGSSAVILLAAGASPTFSQTKAAEAVFERFCELDSHRAQLTPGGWKEVAALFVRPGAPRNQTILITDLPEQATVGRGTMEGRRVCVGRDFLLFGRLELPGIRFAAEAQGKLIRELIYVTKIAGPGQTESWRIEGPVPEPRLTVAAAIRYVSEVRENTRDSNLRTNADGTLAALRRLLQ